MSRPTRFDAAFYVPWLGPLLEPGTQRAPGGMEAQILHLARGMAGRGHSVCLIVRDTDKGLPDSVDGISIAPIRLRRGPRARSELLWELRFGLALLRVVLRVPARTVIQRGAGIETGLTAIATRLRGQRRFVYMSANVVDFELEKWDPSRRNRALFDLGIRLADEIVVQTSEQVEMCRRRYGRDPVLIRSVAESAERAGVADGPALWIGRLAAYKHPDRFIALAEAMPDRRFVMVASADQLDEQPLRARAAKLENLTWLDALPRAELLELIERSAAVISTSEVEGMPNVFLEAWARGVPTLTLDFDPDGVIERERLGVAAGGDLGRLVDALEDLYTRPEAREQLSERCVDYVRREHGLEAVLDRFERAAAIEGHEPGGDAAILRRS